MYYTCSTIKPRKQTGTITLIVIAVLGLIGTALLVSLKKDIAPNTSSTVSFWLLIAICLSITIFSITTAIYRTRTISYLKQHIREALPAIERVITNSHSMLTYYERRMWDYSYSLGRADIKYLTIIRRILAALEHRHAQLVKLSASHKLEDIKKAHLLLGTPITIHSDGINSLIESAPFPPIKPQAIASVLEGLFEDFEADCSLFKYEIEKLA